MFGFSRKLRPWSAMLPMHCPTSPETRRPPSMCDFLPFLYSFVNEHLALYHASWKVVDFFVKKIPGPGKSWKITLVLESPEN